MNIRVQIEGALATERERKLKEQKERREALKKQYPAFGAIEEKCSNALQNLLSGDGETFDQLIKEREAIIAELQLEEKLSIQYDCPLCEDRGYLDNGRTCVCLQKRLVQAYFEMSDLEGILAEQNFQCYNPMVFSDEPLEGKEYSAREWMDRVRTKMEHYVEEFTPRQAKNLLFYGPTGTGKTFMTGCVAKALLERGKIVIYMTAMALMSLYQELTFGNTPHRGDLKEKVHLLKTCDMLIIDDLGTEMESQFHHSVLFDLINHRLSTHRPFLINTNLTLNQLSARYDDRTFSRMVAATEVIPFYGKDIRWERR
ncbi:MAG: ATP-binding protein [Tissierellia bacterium]|nr:ATP-binding protein [Tissierellia bacterium]